jgi:hypothetical protein
MLQDDPAARSGAQRGGSSAWGAAPEDAFIAILNNQGKSNPDLGLPVREHGFAVLVRRPGSLQRLQQRCLDQTWNECLTALYRVETDPVLGTLISAFLADLDKYDATSGPDPSGTAATGPQTEGTFLFDQSRSDWAQLLGKGFLKQAREATWRPGPARRGQVDLDWLTVLLTELDKSLSEGKRLVLFCEVLNSDESDQEWETGLAELVKQLPERVGLVLSGVPRVDPPADNPHYLVLNAVDPLRDEPIAREAYQYLLAALRSDRPSDEDHLALTPYAEALARLVLLPETAPLTIAIHGPWGKGKSSFMRFIEQQLVYWTPSNRLARASLRERLFGALHDTVVAFASRRRLQGRLLVEGLIQQLARWARSRRDRLAAADDGIRKLLESLDAQLAALAVKTAETPTPSREELADLRERIAAPVRRELVRARRHQRRAWQAMTRASQGDVVSVNFNAWRYDDSKQIWAGLASAITKELESALPRWKRLATPLVYAWRSRRAELIAELVLPTVALAAAFGLLLSSAGLRSWVNDQVRSKTAGLGGFVELLPIGGALLVAAWFLAGRIRRVIQPVSERVLEYARRPDYRDQMGYQHLVLDDIRFVHARLRRSRETCKIVVFIDDLDRCSDEKIMEILQAINLVLGESEFFVFLGIDTEMIHRAIRRYYGENGVNHLPENFPQDYLRKIVQLSFHLPPTPDPVRSAFIAQLFSAGARQGANGAAPVQTSGPAVEPGGLTLRWDFGQLRAPVRQVIKEVEDTPEELKAFQDFRAMVEDNPREQKRLVNAHRFIKILLQPDNAPAPTGEAQRKLVKWLIFCSRWPHLVQTVLDHARANPDDLDCLATVSSTLESEDDRKAVNAFARVARPADSLTASDLDADEALARAAQISELVLRGQ